MATHTKAPWEKLGNWIVLIGKRHHIDLYRATDYDDELDEAEANARLISAAPDLLEAVEQLLKCHDAGSEQLAEEALRKARGWA